ncbi:MAG: hypothetical protein E7559_03245 [Ruminococcaceae bacterium]|nr:hypothetical protein [Oscillospiraceae bacterium]
MKNNDNMNIPAETLNRYRNIAVVCLTAAVIAVLSFWCWFKEENTFSESERRVLKTLPELSWESIAEGDFMAEFESYTQDQFPLRDSFRSVKSAASFYAFGKRDNNGLYIAEGSVSKLDYPMNTAGVDHACDRLKYLYDEYISGSDAKVYLSIVPDKNYFLAEKNGYLSMDYDRFTDYVRERTDYMEYIDVADTLDTVSYYRTDSHWRQEVLAPTVERLAQGMGVDVLAEYTENTLDNPFYGVYSGQIALPLEPDEIKYLTSETLDGCVVTSYDTGEPVARDVYDMKKAYSRDPYEMFLGGADALMTIENPNAESERELVMFRDSFASSIAPLLVEGYAKITMIDIRYIRSEMVGNYVTFDDQDVLFIYSTMMLNSGSAFK